MSSSRMFKHAMARAPMQLATKGQATSLVLSNGAVINYNPTTDVFTKVAQLPVAGECQAVDISPNGVSYFFATGTLADQYYYYTRSADSFTARTLSIAPYRAYDVRWSPDGNYMSTAGQARYQNSYIIDGSTGLLANYGSFVWSGAGGGFSGAWAWSPDSNWLVLSSTQTPWLIIDKNDKVNKKFVLAAGTPTVAAATTPGYTQWLDASTFVWCSQSTAAPIFFTINPTTESVAQDTTWSGITTTNVRRIRMSKDGLYVAIGHTAGVDVYKRTGAKTFTRIWQATDLTATDKTITAVDFSSDGVYLAVAGPNLTNKLHLYRRSGDSFNPIPMANIPAYGTYAGNDLKFSPV